MAGVYRPRHPERTVLYRVLFHYFERFMAEHEERFEREYGHSRPIVKEVVGRYPVCGNARYGFARIGCPDSAEERLVMFPWRTRGFCPSCQAKRIEEWGDGIPIGPRRPRDRDDGLPGVHRPGDFADSGPLLEPSLTPPRLPFILPPDG